MKRMLCLLLCGLMCLAPLAAPAEEDTSLAASGVQSASLSQDEPASLLEEAIGGGVADDDLPIDEAATVAETDEADNALPSVTGMTPLYTTKIKLMTSTGTAVTLRAKQDTESQSLGVVGKGEVVTIYKVYPSFVLVGFEGKVGYILRTCIDENCTVLDPASTPAYGVMMMKYVATTTAVAPVHESARASSGTFPIEVGKGSRVSVIDFVNGYAKVYYWRSYGYIDAKLLTDLTVVSATDEPMSDETPIASFCSFFKYNTGSEANDGRVKNIVRSCELMTRVLQPGESLNFNSQIGPYKKANGYFPAPVLIGGGSQLGYGGGTCQSSSTLYNTIRQLPGITVLMRRPHGPGSARYLPQHTDAAVGNESLNLIFRNDYPFAIRILAESTGEGVINIQIFKES